MARILIGNIQGPQGKQGIQGKTGATGLQGPQGPLPPLVADYLATATGTGALDAYMGKLIDARLNDLMNKFTTLNGELGKTSISGTAIRDNTRRGIYCGNEFLDSPLGTGWYTLIYAFNESGDSGFAVAWGMNGEGGGHIYYATYSAGWGSFNRML